MTEHVVGGNASGDLAQRVVCHAQFLRGKFQALVPKFIGGRFRVRTRTLQRFDVARAGRKFALAGIAGIACRQRAQALMQRGDAVAGNC